jgi:predicted Zn-dependent protease
MSGIPRNTTLNQNESNKDMDNFNSLMTTDVGGLIQCDSKRVIEIATASIVLNSESVIVPNVLLIQIGRKELK